MARLLLCMLEVNALETASEATLHFPFYKSRQSGLIENRLALKPAVKNEKEHHRGCAWLAIHTVRSMQSIFLTVVRRVLNMYVVQSVFFIWKTDAVVAPAFSAARADREQLLLYMQSNGA